MSHLFLFSAQPHFIGVDHDHEIAGIDVRCENWFLFSAKQICRFDRDLAERLHGDPELNMVVGSRFLDPDGEGYRSSAARRVGIRLFSRVVSLITGQRVTDPTSGFRMTDRRGIELFARDYPLDYPEVEAILLMHAHRLNSCEIPVEMRPRLTGESVISSSQSIYYMIKVMLAIFVGLFRRRPVPEAGADPVVPERGI